jgi:hypothetical protein
VSGGTGARGLSFSGGDCGRYTNSSSSSNSINDNNNDNSNITIIG